MTEDTTIEGMNELHNCILDSEKQLNNLKDQLLDNSHLRDDVEENTYDNIVHNDDLKEEPSHESNIIIEIIEDPASAMDQPRSEDQEQNNENNEKPTKKSKGPTASFLKNMKKYEDKMAKDKLQAMAKKKDGGNNPGVNKSRNRGIKPKMTENGLVLPSKDKYVEKPVLSKPVRVKQVIAQDPSPEQDVVINKIDMEQHVNNYLNEVHHGKDDLASKIYAKGSIPPSYIKHMSYDEKQKASIIMSKVDKKPKIPPKYASIIENNIKKSAISNIKSFTDLRMAKEAEGLNLDIKSKNATLEQIRRLKQEHKTKERTDAMKKQNNSIESKDSKINKIMNDTTMTKFSKIIAIDRMSIDNRRNLSKTRMMTLPPGVSQE
jgi:hypothetical protein